MKSSRYIILCCTLGALFIGCSDKQEQADQIEKDMLDQDQESVTEAVIEDSLVPADTSSLQPQIDAAAILVEESAKPEESFAGAPAGGGYTVQVAGCEDRAYAEYLYNLYTSRGYQPFIEEASVNGQAFHRVRIGNFPSLADARSLQNELMSQYSVQGWIDRIGG